MAYNVTVLDRNADVATIFVAPGVAPQVARLPVATNHPGTNPEDPEHARRFRSVERQDALLRTLDSRPDVSTLVQQFLHEPLYNTSYDKRIWHYVHRCVPTHQRSCRICLAQLVLGPEVRLTVRHPPGNIGAGTLGAGNLEASPSTD